jgi:F-type H+-transporting ATPase subunit b
MRGRSGSFVEALDSRRERIQGELDEAKRLREEAQQLVEVYRQKQRDAEHEAEALIVSAREEAERYAAEQKTRMDEFVTRRTALAESKIAQAEAQALADVRAAAADAAVAAAADILTQTARGKVADDLIERGIRDIKTKLN